jgi:preprotein translocase subunit YajC
VSQTSLIFIILIFALMWLLFIRPQRRKQQAQRDMLSNVAPGDEIVTAGGLYGTVRAVDDEALMLEIAPGTEVRVAKRAVAAVIPPEEEEEEEEVDEEEDDSEAPEPDQAGEPEAEVEAYKEPADAVAQGDSAAEARR